MIALAYAVLFGVPVLAALAILTHNGTARTTAAALVGGWLAMPLLTVKVSGLPDLDKSSLLVGTVLAATLVVRPALLTRWRLRWFDLPMIVWCAVPIATSLSNDLGIYDGLSTTLNQFVVWGAPYAIGRTVFGSRERLEQVGKALLIGAAAYAPFCLLESRLAPQLHMWIYGLPGRVGWENVSFYGPLKWKASVFLESPLELTLLMGIGLLFGWGLMRAGSTRRHLLPRMQLLTSMALIATLMGKSLGGVGLTFGTAMALWLGERLRTRAIIILMLGVAPLYISTRAAGTWSGEEVVNFIATNISERRAQSFEFRLINEDILLEKALRRPILGWGGWGRNRVFDENGKDLSVTDGHWIIALGIHGFVGLIAWLLATLLPSGMILARLRQYRIRSARDKTILLLVAAIPIIHAIDCLVNAMPNPIYPILMGGLASTAAALRPVASAAKSAPVRTTRVVRLRRRPNNDKRPKLLTTHA